MYLKDFSLLSPRIQSNDLLKAIETAIPATAIEQAVTKSIATEERNRSLPAPNRSLPGDNNEPVVERFDARCTEKLS